MSEKEFTGKTVEEAIEEGLKTLDLTREEADITVIDEPVSGFLRSKKAKVKVSVRKSDGERALNFIDNLLGIMNFHAAGELEETGGKITINLITTNSSIIIGYRGEVLDALQTLAGAIANIGREDYVRVVVDCENYREKREGTLKALAKRLADKAVAKESKVSLEPMNPYERRIIHSALSKREDVKTASVGKEPNRFIIITPNNVRYHTDRKTGRKPYPKRGEGGQRRDVNNFKDRRESSDIQRPAEKPTRKFGYGTYLGNSLKD